MTSTRGYRSGAWLFGLTALVCIAALPYAVRCCAHFSPADLKLRAEFGGGSREPGITPLAEALHDWPMGFRLLLMTLVATTICFASTLASLSLARRENLADQRTVWRPIVRAVLACLMVGVLYILGAYATGFVSYLGPRNLLWMLGVPAAIALMCWPRPIGALMTLPLAIGGWIALAILSIGLGIQLD
jgi:hypothetical protein